MTIKTNFSKNPPRDYEIEKTFVRDSIVEFDLVDIPPGTYAISVLDDVNGNEQMDYKMIRIPKEGYGFSNNVKSILNHPPSDKCSFQVPEGESRIEIQMNYFKDKK